MYYNQNQPQNYSQSPQSYGQPQQPDFLNQNGPSSYQPNYVSTDSPIVINNTEQQKSMLPNDANFAVMSTKICCLKCNNVGMTRIYKKVGQKACLWCLFLPVVGLCCLCNDTYLDVYHFCSSCNTPSGSKLRKCC